MGIELTTVDSRSRRPPIVTFVILGFYFWFLFVLATNKNSLEFPVSIVIASLWLLSPFVIGFLAIRSYKRRMLSSAHRIAFGGCVLFLVCFTIGLWLSK